jgi:dTDP-4-dehydrorhamnose reductase
MKIILIGANGQLGKEVQDLSKALNIPLVSFGHDILDITNFNSISNNLALHQDATVLINAAAYTAVDMAEDESEAAYQVNAIGPKNLATWCHKHSVPIIHISTDYVFSGDKASPYLEDDVTNPMSVYGRTKLAGEQFVQDICPQHIILRVSWVFGQYGKNFVKTIIRLAKERETLKIVEDQIGNPTSAADIARVLLEITKQIPSLTWGIYHYCGKDTISWYQFACAIVEEAQKYESLKVTEILPITTNEFPTKAARPQNSALNCDKITTLLEIPQESWRGYLNELVESFH